MRAVFFFTCRFAAMPFYLETELPNCLLAGMLICRNAYLLECLITEIIYLSKRRPGSRCTSFIPKQGHSRPYAAMLHCCIAYLLICLFAYLLIYWNNLFQFSLIFIQLAARHICSLLFCLNA